MPKSTACGGIMAKFVGANVQDLRVLVERMTAGAQAIESECAALSRSLLALPWSGDEADRAKDRWRTQQDPAIHAACLILRDCGSELARQAEEQSHASEASSAAGAAPGAGDQSKRLLEEQDTLRATRDFADFLDPQDGVPPTEAQVAAKWAALTPAQQQALMRAIPDELRNLDGLPGSVRDELNREHLAAERDRLHCSVETGGACKELNEVNNALIDKDGNPHTDVQLLLLDTSDPAFTKAAVAVGDVDTADHIAVKVPGLDTRVDTLDGDVEEMRQMQTKSERLLVARGRSDESVACVSWYGYETPNKVTVMSDDLAEAGAPDLVNHFEGLSANNPGARITALGHSYGSLTTAMAMTQVEAGVVDSFVAYGSPGLGENRDFRVNELFIMEADDDAVADLGYFGGDPNHQYDADQILGTDAIAGFSDSTGHSEYGDDGTLAQYNLATVVIGESDAAIRADDRGMDAGDSSSIYGIAESVGNVAQSYEDASSAIGSASRGDFGGALSSAGQSARNYAEGVWTAGQAAIHWSFPWNQASDVQSAARFGQTLIEDS